MLNLPVSAPFHCPLMKKQQRNEKKNFETEFKDPIIDIISNVTAKPENKSEE